MGVDARTYLIQVEGTPLTSEVMNLNTFSDIVDEIQREEEARDGTKGPWKTIQNPVHSLTSVLRVGL
jgi:hypothetical protein